MESGLFFIYGKVSKLIGRILRKILWQKGSIYKEKKQFKFDPILLNNAHYDGLYGYFQSPLYFESYKKEIYSIFKLPLYSNQALEFKEAILKTETSVAIHYRDYGDETSAGNKTVKKIIGDISIQYYKEAISIHSPVTFSNNLNTSILTSKVNNG